MKVLVVCLVDDYGDPNRGLSFEYFNIYMGMRQIADEVLLFDFYKVLRERGQVAMNRELVEIVRRERPDVALFALFKDEFLADALDEVRKHTTSVAYFFDDDWRRDFIKRWMPHFDFFTTPRRPSYRRYLADGVANAIYSPFGYNPEIYDRRDGPMLHDVSFVGGSHPWRVYVMKRLRAAGLPVAVFGPFWPSGKIEQDAMIDVFARSRINLNLSNSRHWDVRYLASSWRAVRTTLKSPKDREQIKARHFEIPACGGFQLTYYCEDLEHHFVIGEEVEIYMGIEDLIDKIRFYLEHETERHQIANAGYTRARSDHSVRSRFRDLLQEIEARASSS
jgi:spore maturation protein CgeB